MGNLVSFFPISATHIPVGEPFFFRFEILHFHVEDTIVRDERFEALVVVAGQPIYGESSEAGTHASQTVFVYVGFLADVINSGQLVTHALASIITADLFQPFHAESRKTATVRSYDDVVIGGHYLEIPTIAPELADRTLWASFAEEKGRILLVRVEVAWIDYP